jgi:hypothetical protein
MALSSSKSDSNGFDDRFYRLIGQIVVTLNSVEALLRECIADSLGSNTNLSLVVLSRVSFRDLLEIFVVTSTVAVQSRPDSDEMEKKIDELRKHLETVNGARNRVVHTHYGEAIEIRVGDNDDVYEERVLTRTKFKRDILHVYFPSTATEQIEDLNDLEADLHKLTTAYADLVALSRHLIKKYSLDSAVE